MPPRKSKSIEQPQPHGMMEAASQSTPLLQSSSKSTSSFGSQLLLPASSPDESGSGCRSTSPLDGKCLEYIIEQRQKCEEDPLQEGLLKLVKQNDIAGVKSHIDEHGYRDWVSGFDYTPLDTAASRGFVEIGRLLANANKLGGGLTGVLYIAVEKDHEHFVRMLLAEVGVEEVDQIIPYFFNPLHAAVKNKNTTIIKMLLDAGADPNFSTEANGNQGALLCAVDREDCSTETVRLLLEAGADANEEGSYGFTAFQHAAKNNFCPAVALMLHHGGDVNVRNGSGPLHLALNNSNGKVASLLIAAGCNVNERDSQGRTPLYRAAYSCEMEMREEKEQNEAEDTAAAVLLLQAGADVNAVNEDDERVTALHVAVARGRQNVVKVLLSAKGVDVDNNEATTPSLGTTALHIAAMNGHFDILSHLVDAGARVDAATTNTLRTPLHLAASEGHFLIVDFLIRYGANPNAEDADGNTPLMLAADMSHMDECSDAHPVLSDREVLYASFNTVRVLVARGANLDTLGISTKHKAHRLSSLWDTDVIMDLVRMGAPLTAPPLQYAVIAAARELNSHEFNAVLLERGASMFVADDVEDCGFSPLYDQYHRKANEFARPFLSHRQNLVMPFPL